MSRLSSRTFLVVGLLVALLVAGVGSHYGSTSPDGLERVAEQVGFAGTARESATAESPLADYRTRGVEDSRLSGGVAGLVGTLATLLLTGLLVRSVRRRAAARPDAGS